MPQQDSGSQVSRRSFLQAAGATALTAGVAPAILGAED
jgi:hypothetical protein